MERFRSKHGIAVTFAAEGDIGRVAHKVEVMLFKSIEELLANVAKHAAARQVRVALRRDADGIRAEVQDDGRGFDPRRPEAPGERDAKFGLFSIRERFDLLGGSVTVRSAPGRGDGGPAARPGGPAGGAGMLRVLIADDHKLFRDGLRLLLENQEDIRVVAETEDGAATVTAAAERRPDIVLMDISMPGLNGIEATRKLLATGGATRVIMLSMHSDRHFVIEALKSGAVGYVLKDSAFEELLLAIRTVATGGIFLSQKINSAVLRDYAAVAAGRAAPPSSPLSAREREVLQLLAEGRTTKEIGGATRRQRQDRRDPPQAGHGQARHPQRRRADQVRHPRGADLARLTPAPPPKVLRRPYQVFPDAGPVLPGPSRGAGDPTSEDAAVREEDRDVRHRQYRLHARGHQPGHADDARAGLLLRRPGRAQERPGHHDPELRLHGRDHHHLVGLGYSLCFSGGEGGIIGNLDKAFLHRRDADDPVALGTGNIPRVRLHRLPDDVRHHHPGADHRRLLQPRPLRAYLIFLVGWLTLRLLPVRAHGLGRRPAGEAGACSTSPAASSCTTSPAWRRWPRCSTSGAGAVGDSVPHSIPLVALGTGLLWFGWYGFNAGSELEVDAVTGLAFLNTDIAASFAGPVWMLLAWIFEKKPKFLGLLTGAVAGLATITPCAGYVTPTSAALIGILAGVVCYFAVNLKNRLKWDDALDVWGVHGVGGALGIILLGLMASKAVNPAGADGLLLGNSRFFLVQAATVVGSSVYAFGFTFVMLWVINKVTRVRTTSGEEEQGLDASLHGESAYEGI